MEKKLEGKADETEKVWNKRIQDGLVTMGKNAIYINHFITPAQASLKLESLSNIEEMLLLYNTILRLLNPPAVILVMIPGINGTTSH